MPSLVEKRQVYTTTCCHLNHLEVLSSGIVWFIKLSHWFSIDQKPLFVGTLQLEMLLKCCFLSQQEQSKEGAGSVSVIWDSAWPEAQFSWSKIIIYAASAKGNTDQCPWRSLISFTVIYSWLRKWPYEFNLINQGSSEGKRTVTRRWLVAGRHVPRKGGLEISAWRTIFL